MTTHAFRPIVSEIEYRRLLICCHNTNYDCRLPIADCRTWRPNYDCRLPIADCRTWRPNYDCRL
ncbi:hypothetical protein CJ255_15370 [Candidatus Viridilinea mediisalina]|uniref:Uncharacterized protein n=1 Tax=Candidatus Viridilinea mediisalina TaxID=2024553 RepID=A0A2A6RGZ0_9CHLR|nr:hypothetical protein CJ255_15370 [Candidatus Viridilinea mediisalina]